MFVERLPILPFNLWLGKYAIDEERATLDKYFDTSGSCAVACSFPNSERKRLRIWLHVSENDLGATTSAEQMRNWVIANNRMAAALKAKGYPYQFVFSEASGHVERSVEMQTMPEAFEWVWKGYKPVGH